MGFQEMIDHGFELLFRSLRLIRRHPGWILCCALLGVCSCWVIYPHEFNMHDSWAYSLSAHRIAETGLFNLESIPNHPFEHRLAVVLPVAWLYRWFGISLYTTHLWPLAAALLIVITVYMALPTPATKALGVLFTAGHITLFNQTVSLHPDVICTAFLSLSALLLFRRRAALSARRWVGPLAGVGAAALWFLSMLSKITAYWLFPVWVYVVVSDWKRGDRASLWRFYVPALITLAVTGIVYLAFCHHLWGHPLARILSNQDLTGKHLWSWHNAAPAEWILRLTFMPAGLYLREHGVLLIAAVLSLRRLPSAQRFWAVYTASMILLYWFGSSSLTRYEPLMLSSRMALPALPGICILAAGFVGRLTEEGAATGRREREAVWFLMVAAVLLPFALSLHDWLDTTPPENGAMERVTERVQNHPDKTIALLCADVRTPESLAFYFSYRYPPNLWVMYAGDFEESLLETIDEVFVMVHEGIVHFMARNYGRENYERELLHINAPLRYRHRGVWLFHSESPREVWEEMRLVREMLSEIKDQRGAH